MKAIVIILVLIATQVWSQNYDFRPSDSDFSIEFARLIDSSRTQLYGNNKKTYYSDSLRRGITVEFPYKANISEIASKACEHHNKYMYSCVQGEPGVPTYIGHNEPEYLSGYKYRGDAKRIDTFLDRCKEYSTEDETFAPINECVWAGSTTNIKYKDMTSTELARAVFNVFMASKNGHREAILYRSYTDIGIKLTVDPEYQRFYVTVVTGYIKKA